MSVSAINSSSQIQSQFQLFQQQFQQLGSALKSGNLSQAQSDFAAFDTGGAQSSPFSSGQLGALSGSNFSGPNSSFAAAFSQLSQDLQSGNLTAARQDFSSLQQDAPQSPSATPAHGHHHHHGGSSSSSDQSQNPIDQLFSELGQSIQSGNVAQAQSAYSSLQQDLALLGGFNSATSNSAAPSTSSPTGSLLSITI